jgi:hypothetical protein
MCYDPVAMSTVMQDVPLLLQRVPDARRSSVPVFSPVFFPYVALILGLPVAAACAFYNAVALRRWPLALAAVTIGVLGWVGFGLVCVLAVHAGLENFLLALLPARLLNVGLGVVLAWSQWAHARGHGFLGGSTIPLLPAVLVAFVIRLVLPAQPLLVLEGLWLLLLR